MQESMTGIYERNGDSFTPLGPAKSPWNPTHQSGVAIAGLLAHSLETTPTLAPMTMARFTLDILKPAPMTPVTITLSVVRDGARMQNLEVQMLAGGSAVARASCLRVRALPTPVAGVLAHPTVSAEAAPRTPLVRRDPTRSGLQARIVSGGLTKRGPGEAWARMPLDLFAGTPVTPLVTAIMTADLGSAVGTVLDSRVWSFANLDLAVHFLRPPSGEWISITSETESAGEGLALVDSTLCDAEGEFARAHQTLFVAALPVRAPLQGVEA